jgi:hypothetical protein
MTPRHQDPIVIACAADDRYVQHLAVMLQSVIANLGSQCTSCTAGSMSGIGWI